MAASAASGAVTAVLDREAAMVAVMAASAESEAVAAVVDREAATAATAATAAAAAVKAARAKQVAVAASMRTLGGGGCRKVSGHKQMPQVHTRKACRRCVRTGLPNARTH